MAFNSVGDDIYVPAPGHGDGYEYVVSYGTEDWGDGNVASGWKIRMVQPPVQRAGYSKGKEHGAILGRQAPTFPTPEEWESVKAAMDTLIRLHASDAALRGEPVMSIAAYEDPQHVPAWGDNAYWIHMPPRGPAVRTGQLVTVNGAQVNYRVRQVWDSTPPEAPGKKVLLTLV